MTKRTVGVAAIASVLALAGCGSTASHSSSNSGGTANSPATTTASTTTTIAGRKVTGKLVTLGAGNFSVGTDVQPGLYDVTAGSGQSGNFIVQGTDSYDEILGSADGVGVPKIRAKLSSGDSVQISGLSSVTFTPVTSPYVTAYGPVTLYAGTWMVGQDLGPGRYTAAPGVGQSGNFIIMSQGVDDILGDTTDGGVPNVTFNVSKGDVIEISGLSQVTLTPQS